MATSGPLSLRIVGFRGVPRGRGYMLAEAVSAADDALDIVVIAPGVTPSPEAPPPGPDGPPDMGIPSYIRWSDCVACAASNN
ncbi:MAG: hypothetical protein AB7O78_09240 [Thermoleophilia bacterium]